MNDLIKQFEHAIAEFYSNGMTDKQAEKIAELRRKLMERAI